MVRYRRDAATKRLGADNVSMDILQQRTAVANTSSDTNARRVGFAGEEILGADVETGAVEVIEEAIGVELGNAAVDLQALAQTSGGMESIILCVGAELLAQVEVVGLNANATGQRNLRGRVQRQTNSTLQRQVGAGRRSRAEHGQSRYGDFERRLHSCLLVLLKL
jgi:hypothetical protein